MKSARRSYFGPAIIVALTSLALLACDGSDHMTEQEMHEPHLQKLLRFFSRFI